VIDKGTWHAKCCPLCATIMARMVLPVACQRSKNLSTTRE
jgi:hypothetical protein